MTLSNKFTLKIPLVIAINLKGKGVNLKNTLKSMCSKCNFIIKFINTHPTNLNILTSFSEDRSQLNNPNTEAIV